MRSAVFGRGAASGVVSVSAGRRYRASWALAAGALALLVVLPAFGAWSASNLKGAFDKEEASRRLLSHLHAILYTMIDMETGQRGYVPHRRGDVSRSLSRGDAPHRR